MAPEKGLSAFEARRRENLAINEQLLKDSADAGAKIKKAAKPLPKPVSAPRKRKATEPVQRTRVMPTRQSARLSSGTGAETEFQSIKTEAEEKALFAPAKRVRTGGDLDLKGLLVDARWANGTEALASFAQGAQPGLRTFTDEDIKDTEDEKLADLRKGMNDLELYDGWQPNDIKLTPERIYALAFHPIKGKPFVIAGDKKGVMGLFDGSQEKPDYDDEDADIPAPQVIAIQAHNRTISSIVVPEFDQNSIISSSYDSSVRCIDLPTQVSTQLWQPEDDSEDMPITCLDISPEQKDIIIFSTMNGQLGRIDRRTNAKAEIWGLTDNKIGGFALHPLLPHLVATASLDRTLKIWDLRMIKGKGEMRHPGLLGQHTSRLSVSHASWSRGGRIATSSYDDTVKIYDMEKAIKWKPGHEIADMEPVHTVRHNNQTGRWVTILKPKWQLNPADGIEKFAIANMNRFVDVYDANGKQLVQLEGEGITAVPAVAELHPSHNWVAGGTGSGKLCLWM